VFEVLGEDLATASTALTMLHVVEEILQDVVGAFDKADASPGLLTLAHT